MWLRLTAIGGLLVLFWISGCSSQSGLANSATGSMGDWSPIGSQQVSRHKQFTLATHYHLVVMSLNPGAASDSPADIHGRFAEQLARQLRRYFLQVDGAQSAESMQAALATARKDNADILMLASVQSWPDIDPIRIQECESGNGETEVRMKRCDATDTEKQGEMALAVTLYDVRAGTQIDSVFAQSRRGLASFVYEDTKAQLEQLCKLIVSQLVGHDNRT